MLRGSAVALSLVVGLALSACGGDDTVNPTDPDASSAKPSDAGKDGSKDAAPGDALSPCAAISSSARAGLRLSCRKRTRPNRSRASPNVASTSSA